MKGLVKEAFLLKCISVNRDPKKSHHLYCWECPLEKSKDNNILEPYTGHLKRKFIKQCWRKCGCGKHCGNRVVQRGISYNMQVKNCFRVILKLLPVVALLSYLDLVVVIILKSVPVTTAVSDFVSEPLSLSLYSFVTDFVL